MSIQHIHGFHLLATVNDAATNNTSSRSHFQFFWIDGMAGPRGRPILNCLRKLPPISHRGCSIFHPLQRWCPPCFDPCYIVLLCPPVWRARLSPVLSVLPVQLWAALAGPGLARPACLAPVVKSPRAIPDGAGPACPLTF